MSSHAQAIADLLQQAEALLAQGEPRQAAMLLDKILRLDFTNPRAWQLLHGMLGKNQPFDQFQRDFAQAHYPALAYQLQPPDLVPLPPPMFEEQGKAAPPAAPQPPEAPPSGDAEGKICAYCGRYNPPGQAACLLCGAALAQPAPVVTPSPRDHEACLRQAPPEGSRETSPIGEREGVGSPVNLICRVCGTFNRPPSRFCIQCGASLEKTNQPAPAADSLLCRACGNQNYPPSRFCTQCGASLFNVDQPVPTPPQQVVIPSPSEGRVREGLPPPPQVVVLQAHQPPVAPPAQVITPSPSGTGSAPPPPPQVVILQADQPPVVPPAQVVVPPSPQPVAPTSPPPGGGGAACPNCGRQNPPGARLCAFCGYDFFYKRVVSAEKAKERPGFRFHFVDVGDLVVVVSLFLPWSLADGAFYTTYLLNVWGVIAKQSCGPWIIAFIVLSLGASLLARAHHRLLATLAAIGSLISIIVVLDKIRGNEIGVLVALAGACLVLLGVIFFENEPLSRYIRRHIGMVIIGFVALALLVAGMIFLPEVISSAQSAAKQQATQTVLARTMIPRTQTAVVKTEAVLAQTPQAGAELRDYRIAFADAPNGTSIYTMNGDGSNLKQIIKREPFPSSLINVISQGRLIAFDGLLNGKTGTWIANLDGSNPRMILDAKSRDPMEWSPDGNSLAYTKDNGVWVANADGSGARRLADGSFWMWAEDSRRLAYSVTKDYKTQQFIINKDGSGLINITGTKEPFPSQRPWIADFDKCPSPNSSKMCLFIKTADGKVTNVGQTQATGMFRETYSADGQYVAFQGYASDKHNIFLLQLSPLKLTQLTNLGAGYYPSWSKDGKWLIYISNYQLYAVKPGNNPVWIRTSIKVGQPVFIQ